MQKKFTDPWSSWVVTFVTLPVRVTGGEEKREVINVKNIEA